jgi:hypothetical protein
MFTQLYDLFEKSTDPEEEVDPEAMNNHLNSVKLFLDEAKDASATQFRCFGSAEEMAQLKMASIQNEAYE